MKNKKGFTLVELLAVIVILAIILVIAVPKVMSIIEDAKMGTLESTAKMIASQAEKQKVQNTVLGNETAITCESITNINKEDYPSCNIEFDGNTAKVTIVGGGKFEGLNVCGGTKTESTAQKEVCSEEEINAVAAKVQELVDAVNERDAAKVKATRAALEEIYHPLATKLYEEKKTADGTKAEPNATASNPFDGAFADNPFAKGFAAN